jgi:Zn-dependent peptidase ImmA (M78 family)
MGQASSTRILRAVRDLLRLPEAQKRPLPVEDLARTLGIRVVFLPLDTDDDLSGYYLRRGDDQLIAVNSAHPRVRQRFTVAHELGHAMLDSGDQMHIDQAFRLRAAHRGHKVDPDEAAANSFAATLLMPEDDLREAVGDGLDLTDGASMREIARHFGVSQQALVFRLANLGWPMDGKANY